MFNQTTEMLGIKYIGKTISKNANNIGFKSKIKMIENPRREKSPNMKMENNRFIKLLKSKPISFFSESKIILKSLISSTETIKKYKKSLI